MHKLSRRAFLGAACSALALALAGCGYAGKVDSVTVVLPQEGGAAAGSGADALPAGVSPLAAWPDAEITVDEAMYANWVNELNWNSDLYLEKTVRIQGMYTSEDIEGFTAPFHYVYRVGPGCCGTDGTLCGLQILLPAGAAPAADDWMDVYGTLRIVDLDGIRFLALDDVQLVVDNEHRGLENVMHQI